MLAALFRLLGGHALKSEFELGCHHSLLTRMSADMFLSVACRGLSVMRRYEDWERTVRRKV
jgi:hypothetical protein